MSKAAPNATLDTLLTELATGTKITVCSAEPTTYTEAVTTYMLAEVTVTAGDGNGDFTIADHATSGRKLTVTAQSSVSVTNTGTATHVAIVDVGNTKLLGVTTCTSVALSSGNQINIPAFDWQVEDPT